MSKNLKLFLVFYLLILNLKILTINNFTPGNLAIVRVPVADLLWESAYAITTAGLSQTDGTVTSLASSDPATIYNNLGLGDSNCLRAYQLLLHETVLILEERGAEVKIAVPHIFYLAGSKSESIQRVQRNLNPQNNNSQNIPKSSYCETNLNSNLIANLEQLDQEYLNSFWTLKANLIPVETLIKLGIDLRNLPTPINFTQPDLVAKHQNVARLVRPVFNPQTQQSYSVGTRFRVIGCLEGTGWTPKNKRVDLDLIVWCWDDRTQQLTHFTLPAHSYRTFAPSTFAEQKQAFVELIRSWTQLQVGSFVPYVYSGASLINTCPVGQCPIKTSANILGQPGYTRENYTQEPSVGLDCSCLISRAAQIVGIPYFYKNSATIERNLVEIQDIYDLTAGDIIWHTGHVMVVSDVEQGLMIEARGYRQGFGCLHEIPISKIFYGINSYADLLTYIKHNIPVRTLDDQGNFFGQISRFKLLKLAPPVRSW